MRPRFRVFWLVGLLLCALAMPWAVEMRSAASGVSGQAPSSGAADPAALVRLESSAPVFDVLYRYGRAAAASDGAYGPNVSAPRTAWYVEYQRAGATDIIDGVLRHEPALIAQGLRMFHFALAREAPDGSFPGSAWPFHGTALFLSEAGPALAVLQMSSAATDFAPETAWQVALMRRAARYMIRWVGAPGAIDDPTKNHRFWEAAIALGSVGVLARDSTLVRWSRLYASRAIAMERPDGVMPEDGGHDTGYQALGMTSAARYLELVASGPLRAAVYHALQRGESWELSRVRPDGSIDQTGDTRTAGCRERDPTGACKTTFYAPIFGALARWAALTGDQQFGDVAHQVWVRSGYGRT